MKTTIDLSVNICFNEPIRSDDLISVGSFSAFVGDHNQELNFDFFESQSYKDNKNPCAVQFNVSDFDFEYTGLSPELTGYLLSNIRGFKNVMVETPENKNIYPLSIEYIVLNIENEYDGGYDKKEVYFDNSHPSIKTINDRWEIEYSEYLDKYWRSTK